MLFILLLIHIVASANRWCDPDVKCTDNHTQFFKENWKNGSSFTKRNISTFATILPFNDTNACDHLSAYDIIQEFPHVFMTRSVGYIFDWRKDEQCRQNIRANIIAINKSWNDELVNLCCRNAYHEKEIVFGDTKYQDTKNYIAICCDDPHSDTMIAFIVMCVCAIALIVLIIYSICLCKSGDPHEYPYADNMMAFPLVSRKHEEYNGPMIN